MGMLALATMALDHYVSQVHLRKFYNLEKAGLIVFDKETNKSAVRTSKQVCRIDEGNTNEYLTEPRAIEEFLKPVENGYNDAIVALERGRVTGDAVYVVGGFAAYIITCSPAAIRMHTALLAGIVTNTAKLADAKGMFPDPPDVLPGNSVTDLLESGAIKLEVDGKYPQAIGIVDIQDRVAAFGNFHWDILVNNHADTPFFTSDYPVAIERDRATDVLNRIFPLAPNLAVRINPDRNIKRIGFDLRFKQFTQSRRELTRNEVVDINRKLVQGAERSVFSNHERGWVPDFISKNRNYRIEINQSAYPNAHGMMMMTNQAIVPFAREATGELAELRTKRESDSPIRKTGAV